MNFERDGYALLAGVMGPDACEKAAAEVSLTDPACGGTRRLLAQPWCAALVMRLREHASVAALLPPDHVAVQCNYFEKSAERNWLVPVHQDLSIPVAGRVDDTALRGWSEKEGTQFVQAPVAVLGQLVALRLHLDECGAADGALRVVPGSHRRGIIAAQDAAGASAAGLAVQVTAQAGDVLAMRPLLLHASSKGSGDGRRRVLHFVFGPRQLPHGLAWAIAV